MTDLLQLNGSQLTASNNKAYLCPTAQLQTKRQIPKKSDCLVSSLLQTGPTNKADNLNVSYTNHKRPSSLDMHSAKRMKSTLGSATTVNNGNQAQRQQLKQRQQNVQQPGPLQTAPQLLQQLMAPTPQRQRKGRDANGQHRNKDGSMGNNWNMDSSFQQQQLNGDLQASGMAPSNSVLKNLLVSGCDISAGYICNIPIRPKKTAKA